jgi:dihydroorotate dehydrogenase
LLVKLSPDLTDDDFAALLTALDPTPVVGLVLSNTTRERGGLRSALPAGAGEGGLSGAPLAGMAVSRVAAARRLTGDRFVLIASGGVRTALDASRLRTAGADLIQLWTGLVYRGPGLVGEADRAVRRGSRVEGRW